ncbi:HAD family hydrolase [Alkalihalophilus sp. As8PL]|uniref:HAD family hydrolase n=1 Tax=Alkalihalophilus sp. As8PL TaxID=3237103 RepID=A0AB39BUE5_9BACI
MKWDVICFDLDNTLYNHEFAFKRAILDCLHTKIAQWQNDGQINDPIDFEQWFATFKYYCDSLWPLLEKKQIDRKTYRRRRYLKTMKMYNLPCREEEADDFHRQYYEHVHRFCEPDVGMRPLLSWLSQSAVKIGIMTNGPTDTQWKKIQQLGLTEFIAEEHILISSEVNLEKPDKRFFHLFERKLSLKNERKLFVGDSWEQDVLGAVGADWEAIYLNTRHKEPSTTDNVVMELQSLTELYVWLQAKGI